jgi:hypothetical protein
MPSFPHVKEEAAYIRDQHVQSHAFVRRKPGPILSLSWNHKVVVPHQAIRDRP